MVRPRFAPVRRCRTSFPVAQITVVGSVPIQTGTGADRLPFRIKGEINKVAVRRGLFAKKVALEQANQYQAIRTIMAVPSGTV